MLAEQLATAEKELAAKKEELKHARKAAASAAANADAELATLRAELDRYAGLDDRFKAVKDENRELYNTVQDLRGSIRVFCRCRPAGATGDTSENVVEVGEEGALAVYSAKHSKWHQFQFDRVFGENSTQKDVWSETKPLVRSVLDGFNVCVFAYGQTGSGKTHTMMGSGEASDGLSFRALEDIFEQRAERAEETAYTVRVQLVEIYNEVIRDLLNPSAAPLDLNFTRSSGHNLVGATQVEVGTAAEIAALMEQGGRARATAETAMNERSSRSHQVLTVMVEGCGVGGSRAVTRGCLHLIDLAGSERVSRSGATGQQLTETQHINRSLTALGSVMAALAERRDHVPFRDSKLTQLLADSLSGNAKAMMFVHIAPEAASAPETLSTLHFGRGVTEITLGAAKRNVESSSVWEAREAREKLAAARAEAAEERAARQALQNEMEVLRARVAALEAGGSSGSMGKIAAHRPDSGLKRPPQVGRLNLSTLGSPSAGAGTPDRGSNGSASARAASSKIPTPVLSRSGSLTSRPSLGRPGAAESKLPRTGSSRLSIGSGSGSFSFGTGGLNAAPRTERTPVAPAGHSRRWM
jgi:kinesin family protein C2/C3